MSINTFITPILKPFLNFETLEVFKPEKVIISQYNHDNLLTNMFATIHL